MDNVLFSFARPFGKHRHLTPSERFLERGSRKKPVQFPRKCPRLLRFFPIKVLRLPPCNKDLLHPLERNLWVVYNEARYVLSAIAGQPLFRLALKLQA